MPSAETFWLLIDGIANNATMIFTTAANTYIIDDPAVSFLDVMIGFVVLELVLDTFNYLRPSGPGETFEGTESKARYNRKALLRGRRRRI